MFRERGNAVLAEDPADQPSSSPDGDRLSRKARRRAALKAVEEARTSPIPLPEAPAAPPAEEPAATPDIQTETAKHTDAELAPPAPRRSLRKLILMFGAVAALAAGAWYGHYYWTVGRFYVSTDDAYVGAKTATIGAKVSGYVTEVAIDDNAHVRAGDVMVRIDDGDYQLAVQTAKDNVATEQATIDRIGKQIEAQNAAVDQAKAQLASVQAGLTRAELELQRQQALSVKDFASHQTLEQAQASRDQAVAAVQSAQAGIEAAEANVAVLKGQQNEAENTLKQLETVLAKAERDLSFTVIRAPFDGVMGNRAVQVGRLCSARAAPRHARSARRGLYRCELQGDAARPSPAGPEGVDLGRCAARPRTARQGRERCSGVGLGVLAAAARQRHRQFHQDRAARCGAHRSADECRRARSAAAGHVGRGQRRHEEDRRGDGCGH